jgi:hypothetical protein
MCILTPPPPYLLGDLFVSPSLTQLEKLVSYILASDYLGNGPLETKTEVGVGFVIYEFI